MKNYFRITIGLSLYGILLISAFTAVLFRFPRTYNDIVLRYANEFNVEPAFIHAVIWAESGYDRFAVSRMGAKGLMQLMPATAEYVAGILRIEFSKELLFEPEYNIRLGTFYLSRMLRRFGSDRNAIAAYNAGEGNVSNWIARDLTEFPFRETRNYVRRVTFARRVYRFLGV